MAINFAKNLAALKQKAGEAFKAAIVKAKNTLVSLAKSKIKEFINVYISAGNTKIKPIIDAIKTLKSTIKNAVLLYKRVIDAAKSAKALAIGTPSELSIASLEKAAEEYKNNKLKIIGVDLDAGFTEKEQILTTVDPESEPDDSSLTGLYLKFNGAKVQLDSINQLIDVVNKINSKLENEDASVTRAWIHKIEKTHPLLDEAIKDLTYFKPISNEVGTTWIMHTKDTPSLTLEDWATEVPNPFRRTLQYKMDEAYDKINYSYYQLNSGMSRNISTEFFDRDQKNVNSSVLYKTVYNNDYHIAGDYTFAEDHSGLLTQILMIQLIGYFGGAAKLINWLVEVNTYNTAISNSVIISVEGNEVKVNLKGDKEGVIATVINKTPITPVVE